MRSLSKAKIAEKYYSFGKWYDFSEFFMSLLIGRYRKRLLKNVHGKVLEAGIGTGANLKYYSKNCEIYGIDLSREMLKRAEVKAIKMNKDFHFDIGDAEKLPFKDKEFDFVIDALGLCTYPNPTRALKEMRRVCKKDGKILLLEHGISNNSFIAKLQGKREEKHYSQIGCSLLRNHESIARNARLEIDRIERKLFGIIYVIKARP